MIKSLVNELNAEHKLDHLVADLNAAYRDNSPAKVEQLKQEVLAATAALYAAKEANNKLNIEGLVKR